MPSLAGTVTTAAVGESLRVTVGDVTILIFAGGWTVTRIDVVTTTLQVGARAEGSCCRSGRDARELGVCSLSQAPVLALRGAWRA
jgi:hypothetical protein